MTKMTKSKSGQKLIVFNNVSLDGFFTDAHGDMSWAHNTQPDPEWKSFVAGNASGGGTLLFGRVTYEMMASYWPTPMATQQNPTVAGRMNEGRKIVFSKKLKAAAWSNTTLIKTDLVNAVRKLKQESGGGLAVLGSGTIVSQLAEAGLVDEFQIVVVPIILGKGRTLFESVKSKLPLKLTKTRAFANGNVVLFYEPVK